MGLKMNKCIHVRNHGKAASVCVGEGGVAGGKEVRQGGHSLERSRLTGEGLQGREIGNLKGEDIPGSSVIGDDAGGRGAVWVGAGNFIIHKQVPVCQ